jgi:16S rRNA (guanine527-N7)-methyltransferase
VKRLQALAETFGLSASAVAALDALLRLVADDPTAPTSVRDPAQAVDVHVADSLSALVLPPVAAATRVADLGSGAGFPGLALAAALPHAHVALVEAAVRKCAFLSRAVETMGLANVEVVHARAETWSDGVGEHDLVSARALDALPVLCEYAAPLLALGGSLVAWKGARDAGEEADGAAAAAEVGLELVDVRPVQPYPASRDRHLHLYSKVRPTPNRYPRRAGMARKRPIRSLRSSVS